MREEEPYRVREEASYRVREEERPYRARGGAQRRACAPAVVGLPGSALLCSALFIASHPIASHRIEYLFLSKPTSRESSVASCKLGDVRSERFAQAVWAEHVAALGLDPGRVVLLRKQSELQGDLASPYCAREGEGECLCPFVCYACYPMLCYAKHSRIDPQAFKADGAILITALPSKKWILLSSSGIAFADGVHVDLLPSRAATARFFFIFFFVLLLRFLFFCSCFQIVPCSSCRSSSRSLPSCRRTGGGTCNHRIEVTNHVAIAASRLWCKNNCNVLVNLHPGLLPLLWDEFGRLGARRDRTAHLRRSGWILVSGRRAHGGCRWIRMTFDIFLHLQGSGSGGGGGGGGRREGVVIGGLDHRVTFVYSVSRGYTKGRSKGKPLGTTQGDTKSLKQSFQLNSFGILLGHPLLHTCPLLQANTVLRDKEAQSRQSASIHSISLYVSLSSVPCLVFGQPQRRAGLVHSVQGLLGLYRTWDVALVCLDWV